MSHKKHASEQNHYVHGLHAVESLLRHTPERILSIAIQKDRDDARVARIMSLAAEAGIAVQRVARERLDQWSGEVPHQGVVAQTRPMPPRQEAELDDLLEHCDLPLLLILDTVQDPHNLGACLRTAEAAGAHAVIAPRDKAVGLTSVARKAASGAAELIPFFQVANLARTMQQLQARGVWLLGAAGEAGQEIFQADLQRPLGLVLGAEGDGLRRLTRDRCDGLVKIPMLGRTESLNVSVAAGICLFEAVRQRQFSAR